MQQITLIYFLWCFLNDAKSEVGKAWASSVTGSALHKAGTLSEEALEAGTAQ